MCRYGTRQLSALKPKLDAADVRLAAVGLERLGVEDFLAKGYFTGGKCMCACVCMCVCVCVCVMCVCACVCATGNCAFSPFLVELYIDENKKCYEDLGYKRFNFVNIWAALISAISRRTISNVS